MSRTRDESPFLPTHTTRTPGHQHACTVRYTPCQKSPVPTMVRTVHYRWLPHSRYTSKHSRQRNWCYHNAVAMTYIFDLIGFLIKLCKLHPERVQFARGHLRVDCLHSFHVCADNLYISQCPFYYSMYELFQLSVKSNTRNLNNTKQQRIYGTHIARLALAQRSTLVPFVYVVRILTQQYTATT